MAWYDALPALWAQRDALAMACNSYLADARAAAAPAARSEARRDGLLRREASRK